MRTILDTYATTIQEYLGVSLEQYLKECELDLEPSWEVESALLGDLIYYDIEYIFEEIGKIKTNKLVAIANLGRWDGRRQGYKEYDNLVDCFYNSYDCVHWHLDRGNLKLEGSHHDGIDYITFREYKDFVDYEQESNFLNHIYNGTLTPSILNYYTKSIGHYFEEL